MKTDNNSPINLESFKIAKQLGDIFRKVEGEKRDLIKLAEAIERQKEEAHQSKAECIGIS